MVQKNCKQRHWVAVSFVGTGAVKAMIYFRPLKEKFPVFYKRVRFGQNFHTGEMHKILLYNSESSKNRCIECHTLLGGANEFLTENSPTECNSGTTKKLDIWR